MKFPEQFRKSWPGFESKTGDKFGAFLLNLPTGYRAKVIACDGSGTGWDHVSVSLADSRIAPTWEEMCFIKDLFWDNEECVIQFHPPKKDYVNRHPGCLHLWKSVDKTFPLPPIQLV